jgi:uncharacterized Tic20 family protein
MTDPSSDPPAGAAPLTPAQDRQWAMLSQFGGIFGFIPPLIIWLIFRDRGRLTDQEAKESLNFQISVAIFVLGFYILGTILSFIIIGLLLFAVAVAVSIAGVVFAIVAGIKVNGGGTYRYPYTFRFIK